MLNHFIPSLARFTFLENVFYTFPNPDPFELIEAKRRLLVGFGIDRQARVKEEFLTIALTLL